MWLTPNTSIMIHNNIWVAHTHHCVRWICWALDSFRLWRWKTAVWTWCCARSAIPRSGRDPWSAARPWLETITRTDGRRSICDGGGLALENTSERTLTKHWFAGGAHCRKNTENRNGTSADLVQYARTQLPSRVDFSSRLRKQRRRQLARENPRRIDGLITNYFHYCWSSLLLLLLLLLFVERRSSGVNCSSLDTRVRLRWCTVSDFLLQFSRLSLIAVTPAYAPSFRLYPGSLMITGYTTTINWKRYEMYSVILLHGR